MTFGDGLEAQCATSGLWNVNFGYGRPEIAAAIEEAARGPSFLPLFGFSHALADEAAAVLIDLLQPSSFELVIFSTSGSAANDLVMKLVRQHAALEGRPDRHVIVGLKNSYHGQTYGSFALSGEEMSQETYRVDRRDVRHVAMERPAEFKRLLVSEGRHVAAVVLEPVVGAGTHPIGHEFLSLVAEGADRFGYLVVADEVATGFLRTGPRFAHWKWPRQPDIVVLSKGLTNGTCGAAAVAVNGRVMAPFVEADAALVHGETQGGCPTTCAAIIATAEIVRDEATRAGASVCARSLDDELDHLCRLPMVSSTTGEGCFRSLHVVRSDGLSVERPAIDDLCERIRRHGAWVHPGPSAIQLVPPVVSSEADIARIAEAVRHGLGEWQPT